MKTQTSKNKKESLVLGAMLQKIAPRIGAIVHLEPEWGIVGQIVFKSGKKSYFKYNTLDLNPVGASDIAKDKDFANYFMERMGYPVVPQSKTFFSDDWACAMNTPLKTTLYALAYAEQIGFPVMVKPNSASRGTGVCVAHDVDELSTSLSNIFQYDRIAIIQKFLIGSDYRLVVLDLDVVAVYQRFPMSVVGDGVLCISDLIERKQDDFLRQNRNVTICQNDVRVSRKLKHQHLNFDSIPDYGSRIFLLDNANLSTGGDSADVTHLVHPAFKEFAIRLTKDMGLRLCGVDLMIQGDIAHAPVDGSYWVLEINAAPGLDHYARSGETQEAIVEDIYTRVLKSLNA